jgi:hypothetical protein
VHERSRHHLDKHGLPSPVPQRQERAFPVHMKALVTDAYCIVIVAYVNQPDCLYLTHFPPPPALSAPSGNYSGLTGSSP